MKSLFEAALQLESASTPFVIITFVAVRGSAPQDVGAKAIITAKGLHSGSVGGGKVEAHAIRHAVSMLERAQADDRPLSSCVPELHTWNLQRDIGMTCGGEVTFLFEPHLPPQWQIAIFGAGHVAQALVRTLQPLQCQIVCIDARPEWTDRMPEAQNIQRICIAEPAAYVAELSPRTQFVVMTQGHATDVPIFQAIFRHHPEPRYLGGIGSDVKALKLKTELRARGVSEDFLARLKCPIGLPIGGNSPAEIAISIAAELLQYRDSMIANTLNSRDSSNQ